MSGLYTPEQMLAAMRERVRPDSFLRSRLINMAPNISDTKYIEIDDEIIAQGIAGYNSRTGEAVEVAKDGFTSYLHVAPYVNEQITMTPTDVDTRLPGQTIYEGSAQNRETVLVNKNLDKLQDRLDRLEEKQVAEILQTGAVTVSGKGTSYSVNFNLPTENKTTLSGTSIWGGATGNIKSNLQTWAKVLRDNGYSATDLYMQGDAADLLIADASTSTGSLYGLLDNRRIMVGDIDVQQVADQRASYIGRLMLPGVTINLWAYYGGYRTDASTFVEYMTQYRAVMVGSGFGIEPCYGKIENFKAGFVGRRFPNMWEDNAGKFRYIGMESSPCMVGRNIRAIFSAIVVS